MERRHPRFSFLLKVAFVILAGALLGYVAGVRFTMTPSMPSGFYQLREGSLAKGTMVLFCPPVSAAAFAVERGYLHRGACEGGTEPLGKYVLGLPGDTIWVQPEGIALNGAAIPASSVYHRDRLGRELLHIPFGQHVVGEDSLFLFSSHHPRSFDSRYFGPVPRSSVISVIRPLWTAK